VFGIFSVGLNYTFAYWALTEVAAGTAMILLAIVPLLTVILASIQGVEAFRIQRLAGAAVAAAGIAFVFQSNVTSASPRAFAALFAGALCVAQSNVMIKKFPRVHPAMESGVGMLIGGLLLLLLSFGTGEPWLAPSTLTSQLSLIYLVALGSIALFILYLDVLTRWTATGASYIMLVAPLVTIILGAAILAEPIKPDFLFGGALVLSGVYVGAFAARPSGLRDNKRQS
jgi:drug/metabolite transporter (DMT)-like permease